MMASRFGWLGAGMLMAGLILSESVVAQRHRDPLTQAEIDKIRDASWEPRERLTLYVQFARARLVKLEEIDRKSVV